MKYITSIYSSSLFFAGLICINLVLGCSGGSDKTDMSNLPKFTDFSSSANIDFTEIRSLGQIATFGDINNDNYQDFVAGNARSRPDNTFLYLNNKDNTFLNITTNSGVVNSRNRSATFADYNNDGLLDLAIGTIQVSSPPILYKNLGDLQFTDVTAEVGIDATGGSAFQTFWLDYNNDGLVDLLQVNVGGKVVPQHLYKNNGDGTFTRESEAAGLTKSFNSHTAVAFDHDNDGDLDLFYGVSNGDNVFYKNNNGVFEEITDSAGLKGDPDWDSVAACSGDFNSDGFTDLYVGNIASDRNALYKNNGDGTFTDITETAKTPDVGDARTCAFVDFNSDGKLDIYTSNHINPTKLYVNMGNEQFQDVAEDVGLNDPKDVFSASWGDFNMDGYIDTIVNGHLGGGLFKNEGNGNNNVVIQLVGNGTSTNSSAIGSKVQLETTMGKQYGVVSGGRGCCEQDMLPLHFGLNKEKEIGLLVTWTDGSNCSVENMMVEGGAFITIKQEGCEISSTKLAN